MPEVVEWMTVAEAARFLGNRSKNLIYRLFHAGETEGAKIGRCVCIKAAASVRAYLETHSNKVTGCPVSPTPTEKPARKRRRRNREEFAYQHFPIRSGTLPTASAN